MDRRVVLSGIGIVSPVGLGKETFFQSLVEGRSGIRRVTRFDPEPFESQVAGEPPDDQPEGSISA